MGWANRRRGNGEGMFGGIGYGTDGGEILMANGVGKSRCEKQSERRRRTGYLLHMQHIQCYEMDVKRMREVGWVNGRILELSALVFL